MNLKSTLSKIMLTGLLAAISVQGRADFVAYGVADNVIRKIGPGYTEQPGLVSGLQSGEALVAIDRHATDGKIFVVTNQNRLYTLNPETRVAIQVGTEPYADPATHVLAAFEIIPGTTEARVITSDNQNLRISLTSGEVVGTDTMLTYADSGETTPPVIGGAAYGPDNTLYAFDEERNTLVRIGGPGGSPSPAEGSVTTIGPLGNHWDFVEGRPYPYGAYPGADSMDAGPNGSLYISKAVTLEIYSRALAIFIVDPNTGQASSIHGTGAAPNLIKAFTVVSDFVPYNEEDGDQDGDGVRNGDDTCPGTPPNSYVDETGCVIENPVDVFPVLVSASDKFNPKKIYYKRKIALNVMKTDAVQNKSVMVNFYASTDNRQSEDDTFLGSKIAKFSGKKGLAKVKFTATIPAYTLQVIAVADSANDIAEADENNNTVAVSQPPY